MKKIVVTFAVLCLCCGLCACTERLESETQPEAMQTEAVTEPVTETQNTTEPTLTPEGYYVYSYTRRDGATLTKYRVGSKQGRLVWEKCEYPDGSGYEKTYDEQEMQTKVCEITVEYDGTIKKTYWVCGTSRKGYWDAYDRCEGVAEYYADGSYYEQWYWRDGKDLKISATEDPSIGKKTHWEFYENGSVKYQLIITKEYTEEIKQDEEGYRTYYYYSDVDGYTVECIADETGKLIECTLMGEESTDLALWAAEYNFKSW